MHTWMWAEAYSDFMDGLIPIASIPIVMSGRNWIMRRMLTDAIRRDPDWANGEYTKQPTNCHAAALAGPMLTSSVARLQESAPSIAAGDTLVEQ